MDADIQLARMLSHYEMAKNGWVKDTRKLKERIDNLRRFFEVAHLGLLTQEALLPKVSCRRLSMTDKSDYALHAWIQKAKIEARAMAIGPIDLNSLGRTHDTQDEVESRADAFARKTLIPDELYRGFVDGNNFSRESII